MRVWIAMSAVDGILVDSGVSSTQTPLPSSSNLATYRAPAARRSEVAPFDVPAGADEPIEELAPLVVAHVHDGAAVGGEHQLCVLVLKPPQGRALLRGRVGVQRVDLHDVAGAIGLVGVLRDVEPLVCRRPGIPPVLDADAVPGERGADLDVRIARREIAVEVLLAREVRAPRRAAAATVVPGAQAADALGIGGGAKKRMAARRSRETYRRVGGDAPVVGRVLDDRPHAVVPGDLDNGNAVPCLALAHVVGRVRGAVARAAVDDAQVHVFVVDHQEVAAADLEQRHAVVVVAEGELLALAGAPGRRVEPRRVRPHRLPPPGHDVPAVPLGNGDGVEAVRGDGLEPEAVLSGERDGRPERACRRDERRGPEGGRPAQEPAPG